MLYEKSHIKNHYGNRTDKQLDGRTSTTAGKLFIVHAEEKAAEGLQHKIKNPVIFIGNRHNS